LTDTGLGDPVRTGGAFTQPLTRVRQWYASTTLARALFGVGAAGLVRELGARIHRHAVDDVGQRLAPSGAEIRGLAVRPLFLLRAKQERLLQARAVRACENLRRAELTWSAQLDLVDTRALEAPDIEECGIIAEGDAVGALEPHRHDAELASVRIDAAHATRAVFGHVDEAVRAHIHAVWVE
jgi:hypothetical protein